MREVASEFSADDLDVVGASQALDAWEALERLAAVAKGQAAARLAAAGAWKGSAAKGPAEWLAGRLGCGLGAARRLLEAAEHLEAAPEPVVERARTGGLSVEQVAAIAPAAAADPGAAQRLVDLAGRVSHRELREECTRTRHAALPDEAARAEALRAQRRWRSRPEADTSTSFFGNFPPIESAEVITTHGRFRERCFQAARRAGERPSDEHLDADAFLAMVRAARDHLDGCHTAEDGKKRRGGTELVVRVDLPALRRGWTESGEVCEVVGVGPVPVADALELCEDAFITALLIDGMDVRRVVRWGRYVPAPLRSALTERSRTCEVPACGRRARLELDHILDHHHHGPTAWANLHWLCTHHHRQKTHHGYQLRRTRNGDTVWEQTGAGTRAAPEGPAAATGAGRAPPGTG